MSKTNTKGGGDVQSSGHSVSQAEATEESLTIIFTIQHPAHVHLFRNSIKQLTAEGHDVHTFARKKEINTQLLDQYAVDYELLADEPTSSWQLPFIQLKYEWEIIRKARQLDPDVLVAMGEPSITHAAKLTDATSLVFTDTEHATLQNMLAFPFADRIYTPECYQDEIGEKQVRYPGYHELAYLHPDRFEPDASVLNDIGVSSDDRFVILRLVDWNAAHDVGDSGFNDVVDVVESLEETGVRVFITAEGNLPNTIDRCQLTVEPHEIHHLMYYADLFIGESATMATESAVLGTPGIFVSTSRRGYTDELEEKYGLVFNFSGSNRQFASIEKSVSVIDSYDQEMWNRRQKQLLNDKTDTTQHIVAQIKHIGSCE